MTGEIYVDLTRAHCRSDFPDVPSMVEHFRQSSASMHPSPSREERDGFTLFRKHRAGDRLLSLVSVEVPPPGFCSSRLAHQPHHHAQELRNYVVTAFLGARIPTGSNTDGARNAVVTPTIGVGKGWGNFGVQSTVGVGDSSRRRE